MSLFNEIEKFQKDDLKPVETVVTKRDGKKIKESVSGEELTLDEELDKIVKDFFVLDTSPDNELHKVSEGVFIGSQDASADYDRLKECQVTHILNVAIYTENHFPDAFVYKNISMYDVPSFDISLHFDECSNFIEDAVKKGGAVLCHCNAGISRSSTIIAAYLMKLKDLSMDDALELILKARPIAQPNMGFLIKLKEYEDTLEGGIKASLRKYPVGT